MLDWSDSETISESSGRLSARHCTSAVRQQAPADPTGLGEIDRAGDRVRVDDKADDQLPRRREPTSAAQVQWAWEKYLSGCNNHWMPTEISMQADIALWKSRRRSHRGRAARDQAQSRLLRCLGIARRQQHRARDLPPSDQSGVPAVSASPGVRRGGSHPHLSVHRRKSRSRRGRTLQHVSRGAVDHRQGGLGDPIYAEPERSVVYYGTPDSDRAFLRDLIAFYVVFEGMWFYTGFVQILSLGRRNKMIGIAEQYQYILRDECDSSELRHRCDQPDQDRKPASVDDAFQHEVRGHAPQAAELEAAYGRDTMPRGFLGLSAALVRAVHALHRQSPMLAVRARAGFSVLRQSIPLDVRSDGLEEGKELL